MITTKRTNSTRTAPTTRRLERELGAALADVHKIAASDGEAIDKDLRRIKRALRRAIRITRLDGLYAGLAVERVCS